MQQSPVLRAYLALTMITYRSSKPANVNLTPEEVDANFLEVKNDAAAAASAAASKVSPGLATGSGLTVAQDKRLLGRSAGVAGAGPVQEISVGPGLTLDAGVLDAPPSASAYVDLTDADTAALHTINLPLANQLANLAPKESPALTGIPIAPTASPGTSTTQIATTAFARAEIAAAIAAVVASAPGPLDTLDELAAAIGDDPTFAATVAAQLATKVTAKPNYALTTSTTLTQATHSNAHGTSASASPLTHAAPAIGSENEWLEIFNIGPADMSVSGATAGTGYTNTVVAGRTYEALYSNGAWHSQVEVLGGGGGDTLIDGGNATSDYTGVTAIDGGTATT